MPSPHSDHPAALCRVALVDGPLDLQSLWQQIADPDCGAHQIFVGRTRRRTGEQRTAELWYEAYRPMAQRELEALANAAAARWPLAHLVIHHRLGRVAVGEASVAAAVSSAHRGAAMEAIPWIMERLKENVPIWKREWDDNGAAHWVHPEAVDPRPEAQPAKRAQRRGA